ncbi:MAG: TIGR01777 family protein [Ilumatobacteraceae bacterium]|nr:TIGR01777 family protein [Ilumatobacteraceae bacterium]
MKVLVTGSTGLIGSALCEQLKTQGHTVVRAVRFASTAPDTVFWYPADATIDTQALVGVDAVVHLAGAGIGDKRWTDEYKKEILQSRTLGTSLLARTLAAMDTPPSVFLSSSAIGIYGPRNDEELTESSATARSFLADVCTAWEDAASPAQQAGIRTVFLRTGIVLSPQGGALKKQLPLFKLGLGGKFGNGRQWQSWISITDEVGAIIHLMNSSVSGPVNLTAPEPVTNSEFTKILSSVIGRPALLPIPPFGPKILLGTELANALLFTGQRVMPQVLQADGYKFEHPTLEFALRALLNK